MLWSCILWWLGAVRRERRTPLVEKPMTFSCWQLTDFNLREQIALPTKHGLVRICRADDGTLMLVGLDEAKAPSPGQPAPVNTPIDSILGFALDIGIARTKWLSGSNAYYWGKSLRADQSRREVAPKDFDEKMFGWMTDAINSNFQSIDKSKAVEAMRCYHLIESYNHGRLMYPNFPSETYLTMLRIIEAVVVVNRANRFAFALRGAQLSLKLNRRIVDSIDAIAAYKKRTDIARARFAALVADSRLASNRAAMKTLDDAAQVIFVCLLAAYIYRNKFMHVGFPIPRSILDAFSEDQEGTLYLPASTGLMWTRMLRADGLNDDDLIDQHDLIEGQDLQDMRNTYIHVLPTWYFLRSYAREAILTRLEKLSGTPRP
jgi:hypothetical protein